MAETLYPDTRVIKLRRSPAQHLHDAFAHASARGANSVQLREVAFLTMIGVRVGAATRAGKRVAEIVGALPRHCGEVSTEHDGVTVFWLGPTEYLVLASAGANEALTDELSAALGNDAGQVVDLSANRTTFELTGSQSREVLDKGCALDLHPRHFEAGTAVSTVLAEIPVILYKVNDDTWRIFPRASFAEFLGRWLVDAMEEFGD